MSKTILKKVTLIGAIFFSFFLVLIVLDHWYNQKEENSTQKKSIEVKHTTENKDDVLNPFPKFWKYHAGDSLEWALSTYNDNLWRSINPDLNLDSIPKNLFNGIAWFRIPFSIDSSMINKVTAIYLHHYGASEIYLDGNLIIAFGKVATDKQNEKSFIPDVPVVFSLGDTLKHILAIRYSNQFFQDNKEKYSEEIAGIRFSYLDTPYEYIVKRFRGEEIWFTFILLFGFFLTLSLVHFLLYLFYRKQKQNLFYSIFVFTFSIITITPYILSHSHSASAYLKLQFYYIVPTVFFLPSIVGCLHSLFKPNHAKKLFIIEIILVTIALLSILVESLSDYNGIILIILILFTSIESVRSVWVGFINKKPGAKIIGAGVLIFFLFIVTLMFAGFIMGNFNLSIGNTTSVFFIALVIACIISIPLSMSIHLARDFALTNKNLQHKLEEVESLSAKTIAQEKEKQQILSSQKETLEIQVKERTAEVIKQKEIIEERQKEITDNVHYAKRLQTAILPPENYWKKHLSESFVLYQPKDIVSGDFYWLENVNDLVLFAAADCTGHGVSGAMVSVVCSNALNRAVKEFGITEPAKILNKTRELVLETFEKSNEEVKDGMDISLCCLNTKTNELLWSGANNPLWYIRESNLFEIKGDKQPIGQNDNPKPFTIHSINLQQGDTVYIFTDGYADQFGGEKGKKFMYRPLKELLLSIQNKPIIEQQEELHQKFTNWKKNTEQTDDVLVIGFKI
ncbi:MAG: SpoIIE family protein phosphatase [Flavobacteriales bacterium]|nr:SpoIIE family protein phosphatase [Flavobacteriales bacterium]